MLGTQQQDVTRSAGYKRKWLDGNISLTWKINWVAQWPDFGFGFMLCDVMFGWYRFLKTKMAQTKNQTFSRKYIFIHGAFSSQPCSLTLTKGLQYHRCFRKGKAVSRRSRRSPRSSMSWNDITRLCCRNRRPPKLWDMRRCSKPPLGYLVVVF